MSNFTQSHLPAIAIIGHTNTGKTSLMRTLLKDDGFGEIKNASATTRHVSQSAVLIDGIAYAYLYDTPGMEDATGVMDYLDNHTHSRDDGIERLQIFLQAVAEYTTSDDYSQEAKVIQAVLDADLALYVIDARFAPTSKYKDELTLLSYTSKPILPVFNFVAHSEHLFAWQEVLARRALHVYSSFDTIAFDFAGEIKLWQLITALISDKQAIELLIQHRHESWQMLLETGNELIADFLINTASFTQKIDENSDTVTIINAMQQAVRTAEQDTIQALLALYKFYHTQTSIEPLQASLNQSDPFDPHLIKHYGLRTASGGSIGAIIGAGIDVATFGASLGFGTLVGGFVGSGLANADTIKDKAWGLKKLSIDDTTLLVLANRLMSLHKQLRQTGHATQKAFSLANQTTFVSKLPKSLQKARSLPHYSDLSINKSIGSKKILRKDLVLKLGMTLMDCYLKENY